MKKVKQFTIDAVMIATLLTIHAGIWIAHKVLPSSPKKS